MSNLSTITGNADPVLVMSATGTGASATTFIHNSGAEMGRPGQLFPAVYEFAITDIVGVFSSLQINLEWSPITATGTPQFQTIGTWSPLTSPTAFFPCSATGAYRLNCTAFSGGTSFNVYCSIASSMPQGTGGGGGGGSVTQGTMPWIDNIAQVAGVALGATAVVAYGSTPAAANVPGVNAFITNAGSIGGGVQFADNAGSGATPTGTLDMGWDSVNSKIRALKVDASQNLLVALGAALPAGTNVIGHVIVDSGAITVSGAVDVTDRAARLVGVVYGSQAQQLKQTATNFNLQVELATGGTLYDARQIRALTSSDVVTANQGAPNTVPNAWPVELSALVSSVLTALTANNASGSSVALDINIARLAGSSMTPNNGIPISDNNSNQVKVQPASTGAAAADNALTVSLSPNSPIALLASGAAAKWTGLNLAGINPGHVVIVDSSGSGTVPAVKAASVAPLTTDPALVVAISPNSTITTSAALPPNAAQESGGNLLSVSESLKTLISEVDAMRRAIVAMVTESGQFSDNEFDPKNPDSQPVI